MPCNATELVHFRKRIDVKGFNLIFKMSVALHGKRFLSREYFYHDWLRQQ
jgi:IS5 family transposase